ncbi:MAG: sulfotransferase [Clostridiales bacterium]|nr:sulfotransferase [Clostridiales bacterium]MCF8023152.1 sulfotransferase [Clostridiales bacterium]
MNSRNLGISKNYHSPVFVGGVGRSGTTLVQSMLNAHPELCFPPETHFFRFYIASKNNYNINLKEFIQCINNDQYLARLNINLNEVISPFVKNKKEFSLVEFYKDLMSKYSIQQGKNIWGDKDPKNIEYIPLISKSFPNAHVIHVIRDPRDVYLSRKKANWSKGRCPLLHAFAYYVQMEKGRRDGLKYFGSNYHEVIYEKMLEQPEEELKVLCNKLNIDYSHTMLVFGESAKKIVSDDEMQWKKESLGPLLKNNTGKWKNELSAWEVGVIEKVCIPAVRDIGYTESKSVSKLGVFQRVSLLSINLFFKVLSIGYWIWKGKSNYGF